MKPKRVSLSGKEKTIQDVWKWYECQQKLSVSKKNQILSDIRYNRVPADNYFYGMTIEEINEFFNELDYLTMLDLLASTEAVIRVDFFHRVYNRKKDDLSRQFRQIYQQKGNMVSLDPDILDIWKEFDPATKRKVSDFKSALNLRHWLVHGRYWTPKLGKNYSPNDVYDIAYNLLEDILT